MTNDIGAVVKSGRAAIAALGRIGDGGHGSTINAILRHQRALDAACNALADAGRKDVAGALTDEASLAKRIAERKHYGTGYSDLTARLATVRALLRAF